MMLMSIVPQQSAQVASVDCRERGLLKFLNRFPYPTPVQEANRTRPAICCTPLDLRRWHNSRARSLSSEEWHTNTRRGAIPGAAPRTVGFWLSFMPDKSYRTETDCSIVCKDSDVLGEDVPLKGTAGVSKGTKKEICRRERSRSGRRLRTGKIAALRIMSRC